MFLAKSEKSYFLNQTSSEKFLQRLVEMDSQVKNKAGINIVQKMLREKLDQLGFTTELVSNKLIETAPRLLAKKNVNPNVPTVIFIGHSDVVTSPRQNSFRIEKDKVYGSGVADDKGGIVVCIKAVEAFLSMTKSFSRPLAV